MNIFIVNQDEIFKIPKLCVHVIAGAYSSNLLQSFVDITDLQWRKFSKDVELWHGYKKYEICISDKIEPPLTLGISCEMEAVKAGFIDWLVTYWFDCARSFLFEIQMFDKGFRKLVGVIMIGGNDIFISQDLHLENSQIAENLAQVMRNYQVGEIMFDNQINYAVLRL